MNRSRYHRWLFMVYLTALVPKGSCRLIHDFDLAVPQNEWPLNKNCPDEDKEEKAGISTNWHGGKNTNNWTKSLHKYQCLQQMTLSVPVHLTNYEYSNEKIRELACFLVASAIFHGNFQHVLAFGPIRVTPPVDRSVLHRSLEWQGMFWYDLLRLLPDTDNFSCSEKRRM